MISDCRKMLLTIFKLLSKKFPWNKAPVFRILRKSIEQFFSGTENKCFHAFWTTLYFCLKTHRILLEPTTSQGMRLADASSWVVYTYSVLNQCDAGCGWPIAGVTFHRHLGLFHSRSRAFEWNARLTLETKPRLVKRNWQAELELESSAAKYREILLSEWESDGWRRGDIRMIMMPSFVFSRLWVLCSAERWATVSVMTFSCFFFS